MVEEGRRLWNERSPAPITKLGWPPPTGPGKTGWCVVTFKGLILKATRDKTLNFASLIIFRSLILVLYLPSSSSGNTFVSRAEGLRFKSRAGQNTKVANGSPSFRHFFERNCVAGVQWWAPQTRYTLRRITARIRKNLIKPCKLSKTRKYKTFHHSIRHFQHSLEPRATCLHSVAYRTIVAPFHSIIISNRLTNKEYRAWWPVPGPPCTRNEEELSMR